MWDSLCGAGKIRMQFQFSRVSKNLNKAKGTYRKKTQPLIRGNKRHRMVVDAWALECY